MPNVMLSIEKSENAETNLTEKDIFDKEVNLGGLTFVKSISLR